MQKISKNNFKPFLSYINYKYCDKNHLKSKNLPKYKVSWVETMLELIVIKFFTKLVIAHLLDPPPEKYVFSPRGSLTSIFIIKFNFPPNTDI